MLMLGILCVGVAIAVSAAGVLSGRRAGATARGAIAYLDEPGPSHGVARVPAYRDAVSSIGARVLRGDGDSLRRLLQQAGDDRAPAQVVGTRVLTAAAGVLWGALLGAGRPGLGMVVTVLAGATGWMVPTALLRRRATRRSEAIRRALPDALDLLAISVEAGVSLEGAMARSAEELGGPLGDELRLVLRELQLGSSRREALQALRDRVDVRELSTFVLGLLQADALGMSIAALVRTQATEMRSLRRRLAREQAARAPVKILFPLVFFIFPALLVVILGPAAIRIAWALGG
jgi:tight adherence protein C